MARDLRHPKYRPLVIPNKKRDTEPKHKAGALKRRFSRQSLGQIHVNISVMERVYTNV